MPVCGAIDALLNLPELTVISNYNPSDFKEGLPSGVDTLLASTNLMMLVPMLFRGAISENLDSGELTQPRVSQVDGYLEDLNRIIQAVVMKLYGGGELLPYPVYEEGD